MDLGVNIDHVATLRQARGTTYPDPVAAALICEANGADLITLHLREDRRHISDHDVFRMREAIATRMNLEMAVTEEMKQIALSVKPDDICLVPEKRQEITTEGGLNVADQAASLEPFIDTLQSAGIRVSLFIDPDESVTRLGRLLSSCIRALMPKRARHPRSVRSYRASRPPSRSLRITAFA